MTRIHYRLNDGIRLIQTPEGFFCLCSVPLRAVRVNQALFNLLTRLEKDGRVEETSLLPQEKASLERLAGKGILLRDEIHEPDQLPPVSVIIPVKNRPQDLRDCLKALEGVKYPRNKLEVLVVDDASTDETTEVIRSFPVKSLRTARSVGPSASRNLAARRARGEVLAFLDSDCVPSPQWLKELVGFLAEPDVGAVGGYVDGYFHLTPLDRYEKTCSPLNMGQRMRRAGPETSSFYLPTCNLLVPRHIFLQLGGFDEDLYVGEDVDFCWRLRKRGYVIYYSAEGRVWHKHRNKLWPMLKRRFDYGTSESHLLLRHPEKVKEIPLPRREKILFAVTCVFFLFPTGWTLLTWGSTMTWDLIKKALLIRRKRIPQVPLFWVLLSTIRWGFLSSYGPSYFIVRYGLGLMLIGGCLLSRLWLLVAVLFFIALMGTRLGKRPAVSFLQFSLFFLLEQLAYQTGVIRGCLRFKNLKPFFFRLSPCT